MHTDTVFVLQIPAPRQSLWPEVPTSWIPLDTSAVLWNQLIRKLGVPEGPTKEGLRFEEIYSLNDNRLELRQHYKNIYALIIAVPISKRLHKRLNKRQRGEASDKKRPRQVISHGTSCS